MLLPLLLLPVLTAARPPAPPAPPPLPPSLRPLPLLLQHPPAVANLIPGGRYAPARTGHGAGVDGNNGCNHDKPLAFPGIWPFAFPSSGKTTTRTSPTGTPPVEAAVTTKATTPEPEEATLPSNEEAEAHGLASIATVDGFSQVFGKDNSVLDAPQVSRCVWAIVTCCSPNSPAIRYGCFEQAGCHGAFWGTSPCDRHIASSALEAALQFYL